MYIYIYIVSFESEARATCTGCRGQFGSACKRVHACMPGLLMCGHADTIAAEQLYIQDNMHCTSIMLACTAIHEAPALQLVATWTRVARTAWHACMLLRRIARKHHTCNYKARAVQDPGPPFDLACEQNMETRRRHTHTYIYIYACMIDGAYVGFRV